MHVADTVNYSVTTLRWSEGGTVVFYYIVFYREVVTGVYNN
jgi:hypothetical protein